MRFTLGYLGVVLTVAGLLLVGLRSLGLGLSDPPLAWSDLDTSDQLWFYAGYACLALGVILILTALLMPPRRRTNGHNEPPES